MKTRIFTFLGFIFLSFLTQAQENEIYIKATLDDVKNELKIQQKITYYNTSNSILKDIFLHNWPNSFKNRKTPLSKRFVEAYKKNLYFAKPKNLGFTDIKSIAVDYEAVNTTEVKNQIDILRIHLKKELLPKDSITITATYTVKIPSSSFTGYGKNKTGYHLRYWYLNPAVYNKKWELMSNLNNDDLFEIPSNYTIELKIPKSYNLNSNLYKYVTKGENFNNYYLTGKQKVDIILNIDKADNFKVYKTKNIAVHTDIVTDKTQYQLTTDVLNRELAFLEDYLGKYPHKEIFLDKKSQQKNPIYGLSQLPKFIRPFSEIFKDDITLFKALTKKYIENTILVNKRKDYWITDGLQTYLMMEYVDTFYPEVKLIGNVSKIWPIKNYNLASLNFNDKYPFVYQFSAREFLDQPLTTSADSLSNFNRRIVNKYKAGLGYKYLSSFIGDSIFKTSIREFYQKNSLKKATPKNFRNILTKNTSKNLDWFFGDYIQTNKKIDYKITNATVIGDSVNVTIKNKRNITTPVILYGLKDKKVTFKKWVVNIDSIKTIAIKNKDFDAFILNHENHYPEYNTLNNQYLLNRKVLNKPLKFSLIKDVEDSNYNQFFYQPNLGYNFYDGVILGMKLHNKPIINRNFEINLEPAYGTKSSSLTGSFLLKYNQFFEDTKIYKIDYGIFGSTQHYTENLSYNRFIPYVNVIFKRKSLRDISSESISAKLTNIHRETAQNQPLKEQDSYSVLSFNYQYSNPAIIDEIRYSFNTEISKDFSKVALDLRYRKLTAKDTQLDFRVFAGAFITNKTSGDFFSFGLDRSNDYLFELNFFGRSESSGFFSQQFIINEGGFKSVLPTRFANQYMLSTNASIGLWRWVEIYNDVAFLKNKNESLYFAYNNGVRLNFIHNIFEIYFPLYSNNGWEVSQNAYPQKIRFTLSTNFQSIYNFFRRGLL